MGEIWAIILAAGESKRMNSPKMLLPFRGRTIIETVILNVRASQVENTIVVLGAVKDKLIEVITKHQVSYCYNENFTEGMFSSVRCGFRNLPEVFEAAIILPGDQPMIPATVIDEVIEAYRKSDRGIVMPVYKGKRGHPLLIGAKYKEIVEHLEEDGNRLNDPARKGLRILAQKYSGDVLEVETDYPEILRDIDNEEDYKNAIIQNN